MKKYRYGWFAYTDNLYYGRQLIAWDWNKELVRNAAHNANKGVWVLEKHRVNLA